MREKGLSLFPIETTGTEVKLLDLTSWKNRKVSDLKIYFYLFGQHSNKNEIPYC